MKEKRYNISMMGKVAGFLIVICLISTGSFAQVSDPGCDPLDPACPIDGGVGLLVAAGIGFAARKYRQKKNSTNQA